MMKHGKKPGKGIISLLMTLAIVVTMVMSVEPLEVKAATHTGEITMANINAGDIFKKGVIIKNTDYTYNVYFCVGDQQMPWHLSGTSEAPGGSSVAISAIYTYLGLSDLHTLKCKSKESKKLTFTVVDPPQATVSTNPTAATSLVYDGSGKSLLATGAAATNGTMYYYVTDSASTPADTKFTITDTSELTKTDAGTYYVWYMAKGNEGYANSAKARIEVTIGKATPTLTTPTVSTPVPYGTALSAISLGSDWTWENGSTVPDVVNSGYTAVYNKTLDTNHEWSSVEGYDSTSGKIKRTVAVTVNSVEKTDATFAVPTGLSATYDATKTLNDLIKFTDANWAWIDSDSSKTPLVSDTEFTAKYTVPSPDDKNYTWTNVTGYKEENSKIVIEKELQVKINPAAQTAAVSMADYDFGGTISTPGITGVKEEPTVTYYYNTENSNHGGTKWENMTSATLDKGTYYMYAELSATDNYAAYTTSAVSFTVNAKTMTGINATPVVIEYDGREHGITVSGYPEGATIYYGTSADNCTLPGSPKYKDAKEDAYTVYYKVTAKGYNDYTGSTTVKINRKEAELSWSNTELTYNGSVQTPTATVSNLCDGDTCTVTVGGGQTDYSAGAYTATATALSNSNYILPDAGSNTTTFTIKPKTIAASMISLDQNNKEYTVTGGTITPVVTLKDGVATLVEGETKDYMLSGDTSHAQYGTHTITVTGKGNYTGSVDVEWKITDPNAPSGTIAIVTKTWNSFPAGTDFGYFFQNTQQVTIQATDGSQESGVDKVYYCKSMTPFTTTDQLDAVTWTEIANGGSFYINPNANVFVYAKITDKAGNVTYLASDGMVIYTVSGQITESITYTQTTNEDVTADVALNGNTINAITLGDTTLIKDQDYTLSEDGGRITFKASYLQTLAASDTAYTLKISYNPGGKTFVQALGNDKPLDTTIALTVEKAQGSVTEISDISKTYDGLSVTEPTFSTANDKGTDNVNVTVVYKKKGAADSTYTADKPIAAGTYIVKITVAADSLHKTATGTAEFTISKADITTSATGYDGVYDGADHGITVDVTGLTDAYMVSYGKMPKEAGGEITYGQNPVTYKDAGIYTVYYKVSSANYNDSFGSAKVKISPKTIGVSWTDVSFVYDGESHIPTATATGLVGEDVCNIIVTGKKVHAGIAYVATATVGNPNYTLPEEVTTTFGIAPAELTVTAADATKHIGKDDPEFTYKLTAGTLVAGDSLTGIFYARSAGEAAGKYEITIAEKSGSNPDYNISFVPGMLTIEGHVTAVNAAVAPDCTKTGLTEGTHCSVCEKVLVAQEVVPALGHDWSGEWKVTREATATADGRREITCKRIDCNHTKYESISVTGTDEILDPDAGEFEKFVDVAADSPIPEVALGNKRAELLEAPGIFTTEEKEAIKTGADAKVWIEVTMTDEAGMPADAKAKMTEAAKQVMGDSSDIVYFDAGLYKQLGGGAMTELYEPGINIRMTVRIPKQLLNYDKSTSREYKILRLHNGEVTVLEASLNETTGELSFETDKFSTYAIVYNDTPVSEDDDTPVSEDHETPSDSKAIVSKSPKTGDKAEPVNWVILMLTSFAVISGLYYKKKKY